MHFKEFYPPRKKKRSDYVLTHINALLKTQFASLLNKWLSKCLSKHFRYILLPHVSIHKHFMTPPPP